MSGPGTFSGTNYQSRVIAVVYAHILAGQRLGWLDNVADIPVAVSAETGGPGDDAQIEYGERHATVELQAKHGLTAGQQLDETIEAILRRSGGDDYSLVILAVDRRSRSVYERFAADLERIRSGRQDGLGPDARRILTRVPETLAILRRLRMTVVEVAHHFDADYKHALQLLGQRYGEDNAIAAWALLLNDAALMCERRLRRTQKDLLDLLDASGFVSRAPRPDEQLHRQLDITKSLLSRFQPDAAISLLSEFIARQGTSPCDPSVMYRTHQQLAAAHLQMSHFDLALHHSQRALDFDPTGLHALVIAAHANSASGRIPLSLAICDRAVTLHPTDPLAWSTRLRIGALAGSTSPDPPSSIRDSTTYLTAIAANHARAQDSTAVLSVTSDLLQRNERSIEVLWLRAQALTQSPAGESAGDALLRISDAEALLSELLDNLADTRHSLLVDALMLRSVVRRAKGNGTGAESDVERARALDANDPHVLLHSARQLLLDHLPARALAVLQHPTATVHSLLLSMRAIAHLDMADDAAARRDLDAAIAIAGDSPDIAAAWLAIAEVALRLKDLQRAAAAIEDAARSSTDTLSVAILRGRLEVLRGQYVEAETYYRQAMIIAPARAGELTAELASGYVSADRHADACRVFSELPFEDLPAACHRSFAVALMGAHDFTGANSLITILQSRGDLPTWAIHLSVDLSLLRDDPDSAVEHLRALLRGHEGSIGARIHLARLLIEQDRLVESEEHIGALLLVVTTTPQEQMHIAMLLRLLGRNSEALAMAVGAVRRDYSNAGLHRQLVSIAISFSPPPILPTKVGASTHVSLRDARGSQRHYTVFDGGPIDRNRFELSLEDARAAGLLGLKVGDTLAEHAAAGIERSWTVESLIPAERFLVRDVIEHYAERFPHEPFFIAGFDVGDGSDLSDFAPIIASLEARRARIAHVFSLYRDRGLPLGMVAQMLSCTIPDLMDGIAQSPGEFGFLSSEWADAVGHRHSRAAAKTATDLVITRSSIHTASELGLLDTLRAAYSLVAPRSLVRALRAEVRQLERDLQEGRGLVFSTAAGVGFQDTPAGAPATAQRLERARDLLAWVEQHVRVESRPLVSIESIDGEQDRVRDSIGHDSLDALMLAQHTQATLYADDLGLRRLLTGERKGAATSTSAILFALAERGIVSTQERDTSLLKLLTRSHIVVPTSDELIMHAANQHPPSRQLVERACVGLTVPGLTAEEAAGVGARAIKRLFLSAFPAVLPEEVASIVLQALAQRSNRVVAANLLLSAASRELALMPLQGDRVRRLCMAFLNAAL